MDDKDWKDMKKYMKNGCREKDISTKNSTKLSVSTLYKLILSTSTIMLLLPALFSCSIESPEVETRISLAMESAAGTLDVFTFNDDRMMALDSYQHWEQTAGNDIGIRTQNGKKTVFICANGQRSRQDWAGVNSFSSLEGIQVDLRNERREAPCMTGTVEIETGSSKAYQVGMRRIASEIKVNSLRCDFIGKSYEGAVLTDVRIYLTNVNVRCGITEDGTVMPAEIVNSAGADPEDISEFEEPDLIMRELDGSIGTEGRKVEAGLWCYPNASRTAGPGTPFTRLVIEGSLEGETYWWPIEINRDKDARDPGIYRNCQYIFDICLTRKGSSDPDTVIETDAAEIKMSIRSWEEKEEYMVSY